MGPVDSTTGGVVEETRTLQVRMLFNDLTVHVFFLVDFVGRAGTGDACTASKATSLSSLSTVKQNRQNNCVSG